MNKETSNDRKNNINDPSYNQNENKGSIAQLHSPKTMDNTHPTIDLKEILERGAKLVQQAGEITLPYFEKYCQQGRNTTDADEAARVELKDDKSPVTEADRNTELWLRTQLEDAYSDFGIIGEEFGDQSGQHRYCWVIDPIDGTRSFITGVPLYTSLLGIMDRKTHSAIAGFIYAPVTKELVCAARGLGAWYNGVATQVAAQTSIDDATVVSYDWQRCYEKAPKLLELNNRADTVRTWGDGFGYMLLATGRVHAVVDPSMHIWDIVATLPVIEEAGGMYTTWNNLPIDWNSNSIDTIACCSKELLVQIQENL